MIRKALAVWIGVFGAFAVVSSPSLAQDVQGIAISYSLPEGQFQATHGGTADGTLNASRAKCREAGGTECLRVAWCYPAGWAGAMSYLDDRKVTQIDFVCGAPSEVALLRMFAGSCASQTTYSECRLMVAWSPDGTETERTDLLGKNSEAAGPAPTRPDSRLIREGISTSR